MKFLLHFIGLLYSPFINYFKRALKYASLNWRNPTIKLGKNVGFSKNSTFGKFNYLSNNVSFIDSKIGDYSYIGHNSFVQNTTIGKFSCIGPGVKIGLGEHPVKDFVSVHPIFYSKAKQVGLSFTNEKHFDEYMPVVIGNDVWVGANAIIRGGVTLGNGCIIGAGAVVTKDVPDFAIYGGVPAKLIRMRFTQEEIVKLQKMEWWNCNTEKLKTVGHLMLNIQNVSLLEANLF